MQYIKPRGLQCRAIVPNSSARRASGGVLRLFGCFSNRLHALQAPIDWGQSIYQKAQQYRAIVPNSSARRAIGGVLRLFGCFSNRLRALQAPIDWGQSIYQKTQQCRAIVPNSFPRSASGGVLRLFGFSPEGDTSLPLVRKPPDLEAHPQPSKPGGS